MLGGLQVACSREEAATIDAVAAGDTGLLTLVAAMQRLVPHGSLDPAVYRDAVLAFMSSAADDPVIAAGLEELVARKFLEQPEAGQVALLAGIEGTPFFDSVRDAAVRGVYGDERSWDMLGYGGDASRFGGYVDRGFNDIDWLPGINGKRD